MGRVGCRHSVSPSFFFLTRNPVRPLPANNRALAVFAPAILPGVTAFPNHPVAGDEQGDNVWVRCLPMR